MYYKLLKLKLYYFRFGKIKDMQQRHSSTIARENITGRVEQAQHGSIDEMLKAEKALHRNTGQTPARETAYEILVEIEKQFQQGLWLDSAHWAIHFFLNILLYMLFFHNPNSK